MYTATAYTASQAQQFRAAEIEVASQRRLARSARREAAATQRSGYLAGVFASTAALLKHRPSVHAAHRG